MEKCLSYITKILKKEIEEKKVAKNIVKEKLEWDIINVINLMGFPEKLSVS